MRKHIGRLIQNGDLLISALVNIESLHNAYLALVGVKLDGRHLTECAAQIEKLPSVLKTMIVTGRYDLFTVVLAHSHKTLVDFVTNHLSQIPGVRDSETYVVLRNYSYWIPADKIQKVLNDDDTTD